MKMKCSFAFGSTPLVLLLLSALLILACGGEPELNSISVSPEQDTVTIGQTIEFKAKALSKDGEAMPETEIQWSLDPSDKASIDSSGVLTAQKPGQVTVKASSGPVSDTAEVRIQPKNVANIKARAETEQALPKSQIKVQGTLLASDNSPAGFHTLSLSPETEGLELSTQSIEVPAQGDFSFQVTLASEPGPNTILLKAGESKEKLVIEGTKFVKLSIRPEQEQFEVNEEVQFQAVGYDQFGNHRPIDANWTVSGDKAELKEKDTVKMLSPGEAVIVAEYQDLSLGRPFRIVPGELAEIQLHPESLSLQAGQSRYVKITGRNSHGYILPVKASWSLSKDLGSIDPDGLFVAKKTGSGTLTASQKDIAASIPVEVKPGFLADIEVKLDKTSLVAGESTTLEAQGYDAFGNPIPVDPIWSLDKALGRIDQQQAELTVYQSGQGAVRAQQDNILKAVQIEVAPAELSRLEILPSNPTLTAGDEIQFQVRGYDRFNNQVEVAPQLELQDELGTLSSDGTFKALKSGNTVLHARLEEVQSSTSLAVVPGKMVKAVLTPEAAVVLQAGEIQDFNVFGLDAQDNTVYSRTQWSLQPAELGTIDAQGVLSGKIAGKGTIEAQIQDLKSDQAITLEKAVQIKPGEPVKIEIDPEKTSLAAGEKRAFQATVYDKFGNIINKAVNWSLGNDAIGSISPNGIFKPVKSGKWKVTAGLKNVRAHAEVAVVPDEIAYNNVTPAQLSLKAGETQKLEAVSEDKFGNVVASEVVWKVVPTELGHVTADNIFVAKKAGQGYLTAVANDIAQKIPLNVNKGPLARIAIRAQQQTIPSGSLVTFQADGFDPGNNPVAFQPNWSVQPKSLGQIDENGQFTALKEGQGQLIAKAKGVEASLKIEVVPGEAAEIKVLNSTPLKLTAGEQTQLDLQAFDANGNQIADPTFAFEVEDELGTVLKGLRFRAHRAGSGNISISTGQALTSILVQVAVGPVTRIEVQPDKATLASGSELIFQASGYDQEGNQVDLQPSWTVIGGVGSITEKGQFLAQKVGQGYVSCQMAGVAGLSQVQVEPGPVSRIEISPPELEIVAGQSHQFEAMAFDAQDNSVPVEVTWSLLTDNGLGDISEDGLFSAEKVGQVQIQASFQSIQEQARVEITPGTLSELSLTQEKVELASGEQITLQATGRDQLGNMVQSRVRWKIVPESLASVSASGRITAQKAGSGKIIASKGALSASADLRVLTGSLASIEIQPPDGPLQGGNTYQFEAKGYDPGGNQVALTPNWAVTTHIGKIDRETGTFKATKVGKGSVEAYAQGIVASLEIEVVPGELAQIFIEPNPVNILSGHTQTFQVTGMDVAKNPVEIPELTWAVEGDIGFFQKPGRFFATNQGSGKIFARIDSIQAESYVRVIPGDPDADTSRLRAEPLTVQADGQAEARIIIEVRDAYHNPVPGARVKLVSTRQSDDLKQPGPTDSTGKAIGSVASETSGSTQITALIGQEAIRDKVRIRFQ